MRLFARPLAILAAGVMLAACSTTPRGAGLVRPILPAAPAALVRACPPPADIAPGDSARAAIADARAAYRRCAVRHRDLAAFYETVRGKLQ